MVLDQQPVDGIDPTEMLAVADLAPLSRAGYKLMEEGPKDKERTTVHGIKSCSRLSASGIAMETVVLSADDAINTRDDS